MGSVLKPLFHNDGYASNHICEQQACQLLYHKKQHFTAHSTRPHTGTITHNSFYWCTLGRLYKDHESVFVSLEPMMWYPTIVTLLTGQHQKVTTCNHSPCFHGNHVGGGSVDKGWALSVV